MSARTKDRTCPHCFTDNIDERHFVYERFYQRDKDGVNIIDHVYPCVYQYAEETQLDEVKRGSAYGKATITTTTTATTSNRKGSRKVSRKKK